MKVSVWIIVALAIFVSFAIWSQVYLKNSAHALGQQLNELEKTIFEANWKKANSDLNDLQKKWLHTKKIWEILIDHEEIDNIESTLSKVKKLVELNEKEDSLVEVATLKLFIAHIPVKESLSIANIL